jgi:hypothetical protein
MVDTPRYTAAASEAAHNRQSHIGFGETVFASWQHVARTCIGAGLHVLGDMVPTREGQVVHVPSYLDTHGRYEVFAGHHEADKRQAIEGLQPTHFLMDLCPGFGASLRHILEQKIKDDGKPIYLCLNPDAKLHYALNLNSTDAMRFISKACAIVDAWLCAPADAEPVKVEALNPRSQPVEKAHVTVRPYSLGGLIDKYQPKGTHGVSIIAHEKHVLPLLADAKALACVREIAIKLSDDVSGVIDAFAAHNLCQRAEPTRGGWRHFSNPAMAVVPA